MASYVNSLRHQRSRNLNNALENAFSYIRLSQINGKIHNTSATYIVLVTADTSNSTSSGSNNSILNNVSNLNNSIFNSFTVNANIFPLVIGTSINLNYYRNLACQSQGFFHQITQTSHINDAVVNGLSLHSKLNMSGDNLIWTEPYEDASGAGLIVSVA